MEQDNREKFEILMTQLKELFPDTTTVVKIVITSDDTKLTAHYKYPDDLKKKGISMRNIKGEWIK